MDLLQRPQPKDSAAGPQRPDNLEVGVLRRGTNEDERPGLYMREEGVLLRLVQAMDFINKQNRLAAVHSQRPTGLLRDLANVGHSG